MRVYLIEMLVVTVILAVATLLITGGAEAHEWVGTFSIVLTFAHAACANALKEGDAPLHAQKYLNHYLVAKELSWLLYMYMVSAYSGVIGTVLFLFYPFWRMYYVKKWG